MTLQAVVSTICTYIENITEENKLSWFTIEEIDEQTYAISEYNHWEHTHSYLLTGNNSALLIDTGLGIDNIKREVRKLTDLPIKVVTTHFHWDHVGGHDLFDDIYVHSGDLKWFEKGLPIPLEAIKEEVIKDVDKDRLPIDFDINKYTLFNGKPTRVLEDNDRIDLGSRFVEVIHTPGHSPGHICLHDKERGYLVSGDLIYKGILYANYPSTDPIKFRESIEKLYKNKLREIKKILPSHHDLNIGIDIVESIAKAFDDICSKGLLHHGGGTFEYDEFSLML